MMLVPLQRRTICAFDKGKRWDRNPVLEVPDLEDQVHVEETQEDENTEIGAIAVCEGELLAEALIGPLGELHAAIKANSSYLHPR